LTPARVSWEALTEERIPLTPTVFSLIAPVIEDAVRPADPASDHG
jgi:hypothetical protein